MSGSCITCRYACSIDPKDVDADGTDFDLECHRMPPHVAGDGEFYGVYWPLVSGFDWCGEWRACAQESKPCR